MAQMCTNLNTLYNFSTSPQWLDMLTWDTRHKQCVSIGSQKQIWSECMDHYSWGPFLKFYIGNSKVLGWLNARFWLLSLSISTIWENCFQQSATGEQLGTVLHVIISNIVFWVAIGHLWCYNPWLGNFLTMAFVTQTCCYILPYSCRHYTIIVWV